MGESLALLYYYGMATLTMMPKRDWRRPPNMFPRFPRAEDGPIDGLETQSTKDYAEIITGFEIVQHMNSISKDEQYDVGWFTAYFHNKLAKLEKVKITSLRPLVNCHRSPDTIKLYQMVDTSNTRPPILVENGVILDGAHRWLSALANREEEILAYVVREQGKN